MITSEEVRARTVESDPNAIEPRITQLFHPLWKAAIGIKVDRSPIRFLSHLSNRSLQELPLHQGFSFTTLTETDDGIFCLFQMGKGNAHNFIHRGNKMDPLLRSRTTFRRL